MGRNKSMDETIRRHIEKYDDCTRQRFQALYSVVCGSVSRSLEEKLWAGLPSLCSGSNFVRLIPFKDHVNIEARAIALHAQELSGYRLTPKGMLQVCHDQPIPDGVLRTIFKETLEA